MMCTIIEHASSILWTAFLRIGFWVAAVKTSVFLTNRSPTSALPGDITPYVFRSPTQSGFLGCRAAAHVLDKLRIKTDWNSKPSPYCIFIGYSETENLYELGDVHKTCVIRKRDVVFWEHEMGHPSLTKSALTHGVSIYAGFLGSLCLISKYLRRLFQYLRHLWRFLSGLSS